MATIQVGRFPAGLALSPNGGMLYVADLLDGTVSAVDVASHEVFATLAVGESAKEFR